MARVDVLTKYLHILPEHKLILIIASDVTTRQQTVRYLHYYYTRHWLATGADATCLDWFEYLTKNDDFEFILIPPSFIEIHINRSAPFYIMNRKIAAIEL